MTKNGQAARAIPTPRVLGDVVSDTMLSLGERIERVRVVGLLRSMRTERYHLAQAARIEASWSEDTREACERRAARHDEVVNALAELLEQVGSVPGD